MPEEQDISTIAPQKLMGSFSKNRVLFCIFVAVVAHVCVIGGSSTDFIYYNWINPEAGRVREEARRAAREEEEKKKLEAEEREREAADAAARAAASNAVARADSPAPAPAGTNTAAASTNRVSAEIKSVPAEYRDTKIVRETLEVAPKSAVPKKPDDLGISIEETNPM